MDNTYFKKIFAIAIILVVVLLSFLVLRQILLSLVFGFILAFIFSPFYKLLLKLTKSPNLSSTIVCALLIAVLLLPIWFFMPMLMDQAFKIYLSAQETDFVGLLQSIFPSLFASEQFSAEIGSTIHSFITNGANYLLEELSQIILNFLNLVLHSLVVLFTLFFVLRDREKLVDYIKSISPFSKNVDDKLFKASRDLTASILYGQVVLGFVQGAILFIGLLIFGVPNAVLFGVLAIVAGILPIVGPMFVWVPLVIYLLVIGDPVPAIGVFIFGIVASNIDSFLRPLFISKLTKVHSAVVLIGMIGGVFVFGVLGLIIGPLILAYLLILLEIYRDKRSHPNLFSAFIKED